MSHPTFLDVPTPLHSIYSRCFLLEQVDEENLRDNCVTQVHMEKWPSGRSSSSYIAIWQSVIGFVSMMYSSAGACCKQALYEHRPSDVDVQPTETWLAVMEQAHCNMSR